MKSCLAVVGMAFLLLVGSCSYMGWSGYKGLKGLVEDRNEITYRSGEDPRRVYNQLERYFASAPYDRLDGMLADGARPRISLSGQKPQSIRLVVSTPSKLYMTLNTKITPEGSGSKVEIRFNADALSQTLTGRVNEWSLDKAITTDIETALEAINARRTPARGFQLKRLVNETQDNDKSLFR
jgi:hypothetical protein